ncbi:MAG: sensor histidine kinase, partial [Chitinophagaceae bacterium]
LMITVIPAFYQTKLFKMAVIILVTAALYFLIGYFTRQKYRMRLANLQREQQINNVRNRISQDIHDDIGAGLTRISIQTELLKQNPATDKSDYQKILGIVNKQTQDLIRSLGEIVWTINPSNDYLDNMLAYFRVYIHRFMEGSGLSYEINFSEMENKRSIHPDLKRNLFLILKESLNNVVKHAHAHHVTITFSKQKDDKYMLTIQDDGEGFDVQDTGVFSGNGLHNMRNRAWAINARVIYRSHGGEGTGISVEGALF